MVTFLAVFWCSALFVAAAYSFFYDAVYSRQIAKWKESNIPFLSPIFLLGHKYLWNVGRQVSMIAALDRMHWENYEKDVLGFFLGPQPMIMIKDTKLIQQIFVKNSDKTFRTHVLPLPEDIETQSTIVLCSDKARWRADRAALTPTFQTSKMGGAHFEKFEKQMERSLAFAEEARCEQQPLDVSEMSHSFFIDTAIWWHFGEQTNSLVKRTAAHDAYYRFFHDSLLTLIKSYLVVLYPSIQKIGFRIFPKKSYENVRSILERKLKSRTEHEEEDDFVGHLVSLKERGVFANQNGIQDLDTENQNEIIMRQMTGYAWITLIGTSDGPLKTCISAVHLLSLHPEYQDMIKKEIDQAMKKHNVSKLTVEVIQDLRFTEQCVYEASRLITDIPFIARRCSEDFQVPGKKYTFRKDDILIVCPFSVNTDPQYFENPKQFNPERFNSVQSWSSVTSDNLLSFGLGPRKCPGYTVGVRLIVMFLAAFVSKYQINPRSHLREMTTPSDLDPTSVTSTIKGKLLVDLIPRK